MGDPAPGRLLDCNLVMKGGVTSGVVYPPAIRKLKERFRFRALGGASAGAIAAAATAAAEYARQQERLPERTGQVEPAFSGLEQVEKELRQATFLRDRFDPEPACRGLYRAFMKALELGAPAPARKKAGTPEDPPWVLDARARRSSLGRLWQGVLTIPRQLTGVLSIVAAGAPIATLSGCLLGAALLFPYAEAPSERLVRHGLGLASVAWLTAFVVVTLFGLSLAGIAVGGGRLAVLALRLERKLDLAYGICSGRTVTRRRPPALTDWLHQRLNELAGRDPGGPSLTLRELAARNVTLKVTTTDLSLAQPMVLPAQRGARSFFFRREEMRRLFPDAVVDQLERWARENGTDKLRFKEGEENELLLFPLGADIPLVVATRMSLSFPVLLSAVRLYSFRDEAYERSKHGGTVNLAEDVEEHWFSDGGIASNFPIHLFDSWVPDRPTLGITLYDSPVSQVLDQQERAHERLEDAVDLPDPAGFERARPARFAINGLADFLRAVFNTAQSYRDTLQSSLPSYRERIAQVFLSSREGGLNLNMSEGTVSRILKKGELAGELLLDRYSNPLPGDGTPPTYAASYDEHIWVRLYVLFGQFEQELTQILDLGSSAALEQKLFSLIDAQAAAPTGGGRPWHLSVRAPAFEAVELKPGETADGARAEWCERAKKRARAFLALAEEYRKDRRPLYAMVRPSPIGVLRVTPEI